MKGAQRQPLTIEKSKTIKLGQGFGTTAYEFTNFVPIQFVQPHQVERQYGRPSFTTATYRFESEQCLLRCKDYERAR